MRPNQDSKSSQHSSVSSESNVERHSEVEPEHQGPWWSHPVTLYIWLTLVLFLLLLLGGWLGYRAGIIPNL